MRYNRAHNVKNNNTTSNKINIHEIFLRFMMVYMRLWPHRIRSKWINNTARKKNILCMCNSVRAFLCVSILLCSWIISTEQNLHADT